MTVAVTLALAGLFGVTSAGKLTGHPASLEKREHHGLSAARWRQIGALELMGVVGVLIGLAVAPVGVAAAVGLALVSAGAIVAHRRAGDGLAAMVPALLALVLSLTSIALQARDL